MNSVQIESESPYQYGSCYHYDQAQNLISPFTPRFNRVIKRFVLFHFLYIILIGCEITLFFFLFAYFANSSMLAPALGLIFLTCASYFLIRVSLLDRKNKRFIHLCDEYISQCKNLFCYREGEPEDHISLAQACSKLAAALQGKEYQVYRLPSWFEALSQTFEKLSCWWHWHDFFKMKEMLLQRSVLEHIELVKCEPTSLELHTALANAYVMLSGLYVDPRKITEYDDDRWIPQGAFGKTMKKKFRSTAERAIEEFKILNEFAPDDPWIHTQLAYSYHDLQMPEQEIYEYEAVVCLRPDDAESLFKLGALYFSQGMNAKGLQIYEKLKPFSYKKAEALIQYYGAGS